MFLLPVAVSARCSAAPQEPYEEYEGGDPTSPPVTVPSQKWVGRGGEEMHPECALGQTWVHQMLCLTTSEILLKDNLCALLLGYKEDRDGESILQSPMVLWESLQYQKVTFSFITAPNRLLLLQKSLSCCISKSLTLVGSMF